MSHLQEKYYTHVKCYPPCRCPPADLIVPGHCQVHALRFSCQLIPQTTAAKSSRDNKRLICSWIKIRNQCQSNQKQEFAAVFIVRRAQTVAFTGVDTVQCPVLKLVWCPTHSLPPHLLSYLLIGWVSGDFLTRNFFRECHVLCPRCGGMYTYIFLKKNYQILNSDKWLNLIKCVNSLFADLQKQQGRIFRKIQLWNCHGLVGLK